MGDGWVEEREAGCVWRVCCAVLIYHSIKASRAQHTSSKASSQRNSSNVRCVVVQAQQVYKLSSRYRQDNQARRRMRTLNFELVVEIVQSEYFSRRQQVCRWDM
jgi:hypothetical protein